MFVRYEPCFEGMLSAVVWCLRRGLLPSGFVPWDGQIPLLETVDVPPENDIISNFLKGMQMRVSPAMARAVLNTSRTAFWSERPAIADAIYHYLRLAWQHGSDPAGCLQDASVADVIAASRFVLRCAERFRGLLRFRQVSGEGILAAEFAPDAHVLPLVLPHFSNRMPDERFLICDRQRGLLGWHAADGACGIVALEREVPLQSGLPALKVGETQTAFIASKAICPVSESEGAADQATIPPIDYVLIWKQYLKHLTIPERRNLRLQQAHLPRKYQSDLTEFQA